MYQEHPTTVDYDEWQAAWKHHVDCNLIGPANLCFLAAQVMGEQAEGGAIVNVSSRGAFRGEPLCSAYGASKAGLNQLSQVSGGGRRVEREREREREKEEFELSY